MTAGTERDALQNPASIGFEFRVHGVGGEIDIAGPPHRAELDADLSETIHIGKGGEHARMRRAHPLAEIHQAVDTVVKADPKPVSRQSFHGRDIAGLIADHGRDHASG